jgi:hypothetical protein
MMSFVEDIRNALSYAPGFFICKGSALLCVDKVLRNMTVENAFAVMFDRI